MPACPTVSKHDALGFNNSLFYTLEIIIYNFFRLLPLETRKYLKETAHKILFLLITTQSERYHFTFMTIHLDGVKSMIDSYT